MKIFERALKKSIQEKLKPNKVCLLFGSKRVGKTVLVKTIIEEFKGKTLLLNGEDLQARQLLEERSIANYKRLLENVHLLVIDEAQNIPEIGKKLKLIVDEINEIKILATGSSSFDLLNLSGEPLTGRNFSFQLFPMSQMELSEEETLIETNRNREERLIYGAYPELINLEKTSEKKEYLQDIVAHYLLKDIFSLDGIRNASKMQDLLRLIALQTGSEVSLHELGQQLGISKNTVEKYLDLLSKVFVIFRLRAFSRNSRKEISKSAKWYFTDNGIRNAIISAFNPLSLRDDTEKLWENYIISERIKRNSYRKIFTQYYFWRTYDQQEIDLIEESEGKISAYEIKWREEKAKIPADFSAHYSKTKFQLINQKNYLDFIT